MLDLPAGSVQTHASRAHVPCCRLSTPPALPHTPPLLLPLPSYMAWAGGAGIQSPKLTQAYFEGGLRGAQALDAIAPDEVRSRRRALGSRWAATLRSLDWPAGSSGRTAVASPEASPNLATPLLQVVVTVPRAAALVVAPNERCPCPDFVDAGG